MLHKSPRHFFHLSYIKPAKWLQRGEENNGASSFALKCASLLLPRPRCALESVFFLRMQIYNKNAYFWFQAAVAHTHSRYLHLCCGTASETSFHCKIMTLHLLSHTKWSTKCDLSLQMTFARTSQYVQFFCKKYGETLQHQHICICIVFCSGAGICKTFVISL